MVHPCVLSSADFIAELRNRTFSAKGENDAHFVPGLYFSWGAAAGDIDLDIGSEPDMLLRIGAKLRKTPEWFSLNISLGSGSFAAGDIVGIAWEIASDATIELAPFIRSSDDGNLADTDLEEGVRVTPEQGIGTALHTVRPNDGIGWAKEYHTLIVPLPMQDFSLTLKDLRIFVTPAGQGLRKSASTLATIAY